LQLDVRWESCCYAAAAAALPMTVAKEEVY
jgi:hypothetical protein